MADVTSRQEGPLRFSRVLYQEHRHIFPSASIDDPGEPCTQKEEDAALHAVFAAFHDRAPMALCISGGGIRSATFALGVLQGMARQGLLRKCHYLSTVSGGGYIGSWLSAWIHRFGIETVEGTLAGEVEFGTKTAAESPQVDHLRDYSNYLTPRLGLLSADTWAIVATVVRNLLLNWLILVPLMAALVVLPQLLHASLVALAHRDGAGHPAPMPAAVIDALVGGALLAVVIAIAYIELDLPSGGNRRFPQGMFLRCCLLPLVVAAVLLTVAWTAIVVTSYDAGTLSGFAATLRNGDVHWGWFALLGAVVHLIGFGLGFAVEHLWLVKPERDDGADGWTERSGWQVGIQLAGIPLSGALGGVGLWLAIRGLPLESSALVCLGPPVLLAIFFVAMVACVGLISAVTSDADREWWARCGGWILIAALGWLAVSAAALYGPWALNWGGVLVQSAVASAGGVGGVITFLAGRSARALSGRRPDKEPSTSGAALDWAVKIGAPAFLIALVIAIAWLTDWLPGWWLTGPPSTPTPLGIVGAYWALLVIVALVCAIASFTVDINRFSLHAMYRNRLIRAYLGASRPREGDGCRRPHPFTGLDPKDNLPLRDLRREEPPKELPSAGRQLPFHVVNVALNLVKGTRLAWQHRKAASFTFTPLHGGSSVIAEEVEQPQHPTTKKRDTPPTIAGAYQPIDHYGGADGVTLGTALAISGAAVSPNMGYHSSPIVTFLLALLNARLGWWLANPGRPGKRVWDLAGPRWALPPYLAEAFGLTTDRNKHVYLSDGGHFENLGLYEMVLRRCHRIIVLDGGCDPTYQFEDLGNAIRKIRIDLGIRIEFVTPLAMQRESSADNRHLAIAAIYYADVDGPTAPVGWLLYLKPVLNGDETVDVRNYKSLHDDFPHESTADQFFDEDQFESYRMLGRHCVETW
jgi:hypothetical protein